MRLEHLLSGEMLIAGFLLSASATSWFVYPNNGTQEKDEAEPRGEVELVL